MEKTYNPHAIEQKWYQHWEQNNWFAPQGGSSSYCIMIPPPNVTGTLHMGHAFQDTLMDTLIRYHRMKGDNTLWQPGTDHAGIATQMVVERQLKADNTDRHALGRDAFLKRVWEWKEESGGTILQQLRRMGASADWSRERFTMDEGLSAAVQKVFISLYDEGLIYRGKRLVNWDPVFHSAISDLEVISEEENSHMWHFRYPLADDNGKATEDYLVVATTRPETMLGDTAVAVNPEDERYRHLIGKNILLPLANRLIPIVGDEHADPEKGTGCVKITPAHDFNDYEVGKRHDLPMINIFTKDASINDTAPEKYQGLDRYAARKTIVDDLKNIGLLDKIEDHKLMVPRGDRSGVVIEPLLTDQWYVKVEPLAQPAIKAVEDGSIKFVPENWNKTYFEWMYNIQDWCISRQLWWGHRIPAWYDTDGNIYVGADEAEVRAKYKLDGKLKLIQDEDVLDTWFSSALWPFSTLGWPENTKELESFYPTNVLVTGFDIIFFWVARMIMFGLKFMDGTVPFKEVYVTGLVRDSDGQKMSKSKGNVLDPLDLIEGIELEPLVEKRTSNLMQPEKAAAIESATRKHFPDGIPAYGTDAMRFTMAALASTGRDVRFDLHRVEGYRNYCNKIWNATRYVMMQCEGRNNGMSDGMQDRIQSTSLATSLADRWILSKLQKVTSEVSRHINQYRFDLAASALYEFTWHEYCDWYLELSKPVLFASEKTDENSDSAVSTRHTLLTVLETILRLHHPIMPFITEEIWQQIIPLCNLKAETIMLQPYPEAEDKLIDESSEQDLEWIKTLILGVRRIRSETDIGPGKALPVLLANWTEQDKNRFEANQLIINKVAKLDTVTWLNSSDEAPEAATALAGEMKILIPLAGLIDKQAEIERLNKEIEKLEINLSKTLGRLNNTAFTDKAPEQVVNQTKKMAEEQQTSLQQLKEQLAKIESL